MPIKDIWPVTDEDREQFPDMTEEDWDAVRAGHLFHPKQPLPDNFYSGPVSILRRDTVSGR